MASTETPESVTLSDAVYAEFVDDLLKLQFLGSGVDSLARTDLDASIPGTPHSFYDARTGTSLTVWMTGKTIYAIRDTGEFLPMVLIKEAYADSRR